MSEATVYKKDFKATPNFSPRASAPHRIGVLQEFGQRLQGYQMAVPVYDALRKGVEDAVQGGIVVDKDAKGRRSFSLEHSVHGHLMLAELAPETDPTERGQLRELYVRIEAEGDLRLDLVRLVNQTLVYGGKDDDLEIPRERWLVPGPR